MQQQLPLALLMQRMAQDKPGRGVMAALMSKYFKDNYGKTTLPKTVADFIIYDQVVGVGNQIVQFFQGTYTPLRSNFPGGSFTLPESEHAIILGVKFMDGANATLQSTDWQPGISNNIAKNGNLTITSNGTTVSTQIPMTAFIPNALSATNAGSTQNDSGMFWLSQPLAWLGQTDLKSSVNFQAPLALANYNLRMEVHGIRFIGG